MKKGEKSSQYHTKASEAKIRDNTKTMTNQVKVANNSKELDVNVREM